jgi:hypothetical protein
VRGSRRPIQNSKDLAAKQNNLLRIHQTHFATLFSSYLSLLSSSVKGDESVAKIDANFEILLSS